MNIQTYILPEWKKSIKNQDLPDDIEHKFVAYGESMAEYLDRFMMRSLPTNWYRGWTRYQFPLNTDDLVLDMHEVIAKNFGEYVKKYRKGQKDEFTLDENEIQKVAEIQKRYQEKLDEHKNELDDLKSEIKSKRRPSDRPRKKKTTKLQDTSSQTEPKKKLRNQVPDHDYVYKKWMEMVESKPISKSYWHIHEYMSRYILEFAAENTDNGLITEQVIEDFLTDYGKGKRPKTMNHYNRVVYRFWEFYENLLKNQDPMEVW